MVQAHNERRGSGHFRVLLIAIVLMFALRPFLERYAAIGFLTDLFFAFIMISGTYALSRKRRLFLFAIFIAVTALFLQFASQVLRYEWLSVTKSVFVAMFLAYILAAILREVFREQEAAEDLITGAICVYFLIGTLWAFAFYFLELAVEGSFSRANTLPHDVSSFLYFSFVTLATLGYGDIVPQTPPARSLSILEAVTGQLYLAVTIGRLVGVHVSSRNSRRMAP